MKKRTTSSVLAFFICIVTLSAQTVLYNFETGTTQAGTYSMAWSGAPYITGYAPDVNPNATGINTTATSLKLVESAGVNWWDNLSVFTLTTPTTISAGNRYLHIMFRTTNIAGGGFVINLNSGSMLDGSMQGKTRFDANLTANNTWQDIVIDLNHLITNNINLSSFGMNPDLNGWGGGSGGTYYFDEIILTNSPLPRGTTFLTGNNLYDFEAGTASNISGVNTSSNSDNPVTYPFSNPMVNAKNTTSNVGKRSVIANAQWWTGFSFNFTNPVQVDATHKYLHILVSVPVDGQKIALDVKQGATNVISDGDRTINYANNWQDVVYDVSSLVYISGISLKMGHWTGTAIGNYYFDNIYIDDNPNPRTNSLSISSGNISSNSFGNCADCDITIANDAQLTINQSQTIKSITVTSGAKLTLSTGNTLTATNGITLQSSTSGTATFVDNNNTSPQSVTGTVEQHLASARNWYLSSPIAGATIPAGQTYYSYDETGSNVGFSAPATAYWVAVPEGTTINPMKGYITQPGAATTKSYTGTFNTGTKTIALTRTNSASKPGFNLVANPYPSYLDWSMVDTTAANIQTSVWYRTKTSGGAYTFDTYNGKLDVATTNGENTVSKLIPPMQAFWVRVKTGFAGGTLTFDNTMRKHADVSGNKMKAPKVSETKVVRLQLSNGTNADEALVCFNSNAQNSFDSYDSPKMFESSATRPELYTLAGNEKVVINGLSEVNNDMEIPLGFTTGAGGNFTLKATEIASFVNSRKLYLHDKQENSETELTPATEYAFSTTAAMSNNESRFSLLFKAPGVTTGTNNTERETISVFVNTQNQITIIAKPNSNYAIYNAVGQLIENGTLNSGLQTTNCKLQTGVFVVKVNNQSTRVVVK